MFFYSPYALGSSTLATFASGTFIPVDIRSFNLKYAKNDLIAVF